MTDHKGTFDIDDNKLSDGDWIVSKNGDYKMGLQDGRLVVVDKNDHVVQQTGDWDANEIYFDEDDGWFDDDTRITLENDGDERRELIAHSNDDGAGGNDDISQIAITNDGRIIFVRGDSKLKDSWDGKYPGDDKVFKDFKFDGLESVDTIENLRRQTFGLGYNPQDPDKLKPDSDTEGFPLEIQKPRATGGAEISTFLAGYIDLNNDYLSYLTHQIGTGDINKPSFLKDPKDDKAKDSGFDQKFTDELAEAAGKSYEAEGVLSARLALLKRRGAAVDKGFGDKLVVIDDFNHMTYKSMYERVLQLNDKIANSLIGVNKNEENLKNEKGDAIDAADPGIQHAIEEQPLYGYIKEGVDDCAKYVNDYVEEMEKLAKENPEFKEIIDDGDNHPGNDPEKPKPKPDPDPEPDPDPKPTPEPEKTPKPQDTGDDTKGDPQFGSGDETDKGKETGTGDDDPKPGDAADVQSDLEKEFSNIVGGSPTDETGGTDESDPLGGTDSKDDEKSGLQQIKDYLAGDTGTNGGAAQPNVQPAVNNGGGDNGMGSMMAMAALGPMLSGVMGGDQAGKEDKNDKDDDDDDRRDEDQPAPGPGQQPPGVAAAPAPGDPGATAQPAVAAPDNGTPPPVNTPGATVDHKLPGANGPTIKVPQGVADALTRQESNPAISASTAYEGTPGAQTPEKPWSVVDTTPQTGDVIVWDNNHSAIVVNNGNGLFYIDNGQMVAIDQNNLDSAQYGKFQNFLHPTGLDAAGIAPSEPAPTELPEPKITQSQPPPPPPVQAPQAT
ncbi:CHAP domain-containing protein [Nocardia sp. NBC_00416]|uniref:CHAP domain-containing protein n=1 Tax=Nocardia sp. NBC_00416 TaxID=2975991 RepID=UPI002E1E763A